MRRAPRRGGSRRRCVSGAGGRGGEGEGGGGRGEEEAQVKCARVKLQEGGGGRRTSHLGPSTSTLLSGTQQQGSFQQREIDVASVGSQPCVGQLLPLSTAPPPPLFAHLGHHVIPTLGCRLKL